MLGRMLGWGAPAALKKVRVVAATRLDEKAFWKTSALGRSLGPWRHDNRLIFDIAFSNQKGLPVIYNAAIQSASPEEALVLVHDDVWIIDGVWVEKLKQALTRFDVVGVAGNRRRVRSQEFWLYAQPVQETNQFDLAHTSGAIYHGIDPQHAELSMFGPSPAACELLDGVMLALRADVARRWRVGFDERFKFHFYDMDFCRTARAAGCSLGTWPIDLVHQSAGSLDARWKESLLVYRRKWKR
jgi:GT2 family glycosyltransferase